VRAARGAERLRIAVSGMVAGELDQGGAAWSILQYVLGLRRLGHEVLLVEPVAAAAPLAGSPSARYLEAVAAELGLEHAALVSADGSETTGVGRGRLLELIGETDLLLNVSGMLTASDFFEPVPIRAYLDLDPFFNQLWHLQGTDMRFAGHTHFVTIATALGESGCEVPSLGLEWIRTLPPVVLEAWPLAPEPAAFPFTSVGHWRSYGPIEHEGRRYGLRAHSLRELIELPRRSGAEFALALGIHESERADIDALAEHGWRLIDPLEVAATPSRYREFVRASTAEIGIAKEGYVRSRSGWFSDRSACYLACGRPVLAQDTGFGGALPSGDGLLAFSNVEEAAAAADDVLSRPADHARAARAIAVDLLDSDRVLTKLLDALGASR
jgi:glycosyltransferase involved in cell wall biosynthesis